MRDFIEFIAKILGMEVEDLSQDTEYESIPQWDSLMHLVLVAEIEDKYQVEIPIDEVPNIKTLGNFYGYITR